MQGPAGMSATGYVTLASFVGALIGAVLADRWVRASLRGRIYVSALGSAVCVPALLGLGYAPALPAAIASMVLFGLGFGMFDTNNMPILCQIVRREYRATGYGFMNLVAFTTGAGVTWAMGAMRDHGISLSVAFSLSSAIAALAALMVLLIRPQPNLETKSN